MPSPSSQRNAPIAAVVLAAGLGKRFASATPKVLHEASGRPLIHHVLAALSGVELARKIVVVGHERERVQSAVRAVAPEAIFVEQPEQLGTGHAVNVCSGVLEDFDGGVLVASGDMPMITQATLRALVEEWRKSEAQVALLTAKVSDPTGYGRVLEKNGRLEIVEEADATVAEKLMDIVSTGFWVFDRRSLFDALAQVTTDNAQKEMYLPDAALVIQRSGGKIATVMSSDETEVMGANDRAQLAEVGRSMRQRKNLELMAAGVTIVDPASTYIEESVEVGPETVLRPMTFLDGATVIGSGCRIGPNVQIVDSIVKDEATVTFAVVKGSEVGERAEVGPFAYLRPGTKLNAGAKVGTFVEVKGSIVGEGSKIPHLSYMGDAEIGRDVNVGAGTITGNYDGETGVKSKTVLEDGVLTGSGTTLVAPVSLGKNAVTGAGAVVTKDVAEDEVVMGVPARPVRKRKRKTRDNA
ncbi:MAG TPA: bifunctional UDP-N-acetylglucosamine diphosphorylase/glucosamine-1-phosphate N-acetyltransferase GlmU [Actinomycetota bacterium]|nr:bifunctional UDP-N-acetylglucosamine diphosphorylase/glucosamine-1-phosphate N-acetyltransferase GlmU [Actinomycetota bacterium]